MMKKSEFRNQNIFLCILRSRMVNPKTGVVRFNMCMNYKEGEEYAIEEIIEVGNILEERIKRESPDFELVAITRIHPDTLYKISKREQDDVKLWINILSRGALNDKWG